MAPATRQHTRSADAPSPPLPRLLKLLLFPALVLISSAVFDAVTARARATTRLEDLRSLAQALEEYRSDHGAFPLSSDGGWTGLYNVWGASQEDWIPGLVPDYLPSLPRDPRESEDGRHQYLYRSDGRDFKLLAMYPEKNCRLVRRRFPELLDPLRGGSGHYPCHAYGYWSPGAADW